MRESNGLAECAAGRGGAMSPALSPLQAERFAAASNSPKHPEWDELGAFHVPLSGVHRGYSRLELHCVALRELDTLSLIWLFVESTPRLKFLSRKATWRQFKRWQTRHHGDRARRRPTAM
jgi:hypothetical protein